MSGFFDKADITIQLPDKIIMEDTFDCTVNINPRSDANLRKIEVELYCQETAISRGTTDCYYRKKVYSDERIPQQEVKMRAGFPIQIKERFQLPPMTTPTIQTTNHFVEWFVRIRLDVPWWPDTRKEEMLYVLPFIVNSELAEEGR